MSRQKFRTWQMKDEDNICWIFKSNFLEASSEIQYQVFVKKGRLDDQNILRTEDVYQSIIFTPMGREIKLNDILDAWKGRYNQIFNQAKRNAKEITNE